VRLVTAFDVRDPLEFRRAPALRLFRDGPGRYRLFFSLHGGLETANSFANSFSELREFLGAKYQQSDPGGNSPSNMRLLNKIQALRRLAQRPFLATCHRYQNPRCAASAAVAS
jgi:hypothetical protein